MSDLVEVKTIGEVERIVHASGQWDGTGPVEFSNDGQAWSEAWAPSEEHPFPEYARVSVYRKDVRVPTTVTIRWDEQIPQADEFWTAKWVNSPMRHFGRTVRMVAFRQTFRDLLGDIAIEDEDRTPGPDAAPVEAAERDWAAEFAAAETIEALDLVVKDARTARVFTSDAAGTALDRAWKARRRDLNLAKATTDLAKASGGTLADAAEAVGKLASIPTTAEDLASVQKTTPKPKAPQDYLPPQGNRAQRRAQARKKGGRR